MDLFDLIPDNFFSILSSKNKRLYLACLIESFRVYEMGSILGINKKDLVDELTVYLERSSFSLDAEENVEEIVDEDEDDAQKSKRSLAYFVLRRFEECGWIYIDIDQEYQEILNFTDAGISFTEAIMQINPLYQVIGTQDDNDIFDEEAYLKEYAKNEYAGYIYTIYTLITNPLNNDYPMIMQEMYRNTRQLIRSLRKIDSRMKDYITSVVEATEIKDLIHTLIEYKSELLDNGYSRLKTGDNINKYRLPIVTRLEEFETNENIMYLITESYRSRFHNLDDAYKRAYRDIDEMIDIFNSLDEFITEIDKKNKKYIDSTIGKIKFLLSEDDNITGKINSILKYIKWQNKNGSVDSAINKTQSLFMLGYNKPYNQESSLFTPKGKYSKAQGNMLDLTGFDFGEEADIFIKDYGLPYDYETVKAFINVNKVEDELKASSIVKANTDLDTVMMLIYSLIYACEQSWEVEKLEDNINHFKFTFNDFIIKVGE